MALQLTLSCDSDKTNDGPTLIHSTGVQDYKIPPDTIRILQETLTNDLLSDHEQGVLCQASPQRVLDILRQHGFTLQNESTQDQKAVWTVVQSGGEGHDQQPVHPHVPRSTDEHEAEEAGEDQPAEGEEENKEAEEEQQPEEEEEE